MPCGPTRPDGRQELSIFVDRVVEALIHDDSTLRPSDTDTLRETYKSKLINVLAFTGEYRCESLLVGKVVLLDCGVPGHGNELSRCPCSEELVTLQKYASGTTFDNRDMLVAAASVGNLAALARYASKVENFRHYGKLFYCLWKAVVISDQSESLKYLLPHAPPFFPSGSWPIRTLEKWLNTGMTLEMWNAILLACDYGKVATGKLLIDRFVEEGVLWRCTNQAYNNNPIKRCIESGCVELLDYLLENLREADPNMIHATIARAFKGADHHVKIMRYLLNRKLIWPSATSIQGEYIYKNNPEHPLKIAVTSGSIKGLRLLQKHGVNFSKYHDLFRDAIENGVPGFKFRTVEYLYENGAVFHGCEFSAMQTLMDAVVQGCRRPTIDGCKTLVYVLSKAMAVDLIQPPNFTRSEWEKFSADYQHVLDRALELAVPPMGFVKVAKECMAWMADCAAAAPVERGGLHRIAHEVQMRLA